MEERLSLTPFQLKKIRNISFSSIPDLKSSLHPSHKLSCFQSKVTYIIICWFILLFFIHISINVSSYVTNKNIRNHFLYFVEKNRFSTIKITSLLKIRPYIVWYFNFALVCSVLSFLKVLPTSSESPCVFQWYFTAWSKQ